MGEKRPSSRLGNWAEKCEKGFDFPLHVLCSVPPSPLISPFFCFSVFSPISFCQGKATGPALHSCLRGKKNSAQKGKVLQESSLVQDPPIPRSLFPKLQSWGLVGYSDPSSLWADRRFSSSGHFHFFSVPGNSQLSADGYFPSIVVDSSVFLYKQGKFVLQLIPEFPHLFVFWSFVWNLTGNFIFLSVDFIHSRSRRKRAWLVLSDGDWCWIREIHDHVSEEMLQINMQPSVLGGFPLLLVLAVQIIPISVLSLGLSIPDFGLYGCSPWYPLELWRASLTWSWKGRERF